MNPFDLPATDQVFTHIDERTGANTTLAASAIRRWCVANKHEIALVPITAEGAMLCKMKRGLEHPRLVRAIGTHPADLLPLLFAQWPDGTSLLIDGSHTYVAHFIRKWQWAKAYIVPQHIWQRYVVVGLPEVSESELLSSHSSILSQSPFRKKTQ